MFAGFPRSSKPKEDPFAAAQRGNVLLPQFLNQTEFTLAAAYYDCELTFNPENLAVGATEIGLTHHLDYKLKPSQENKIESPGNIYMVLRSRKPYGGVFTLELNPANIAQEPTLKKVNTAIWLSALVIQKAGNCQKYDLGYAHKVLNHELRNKHNQKHAQKLAKQVPILGYQELNPLN